MPELPEVETITRRLRSGTAEVPSVIAQRIESVRVNWDRIIATPDPDTFIQRLTGRTIQDVSRRGKFIHIALDQGHLIAHLRMSGDLRVEAGSGITSDPSPESRFNQVVATFQSDWQLAFSSIRKFSRMWLVDQPEQAWGKLGPEPLGPDLSAEKLFDMLREHSRQIKPLLMDQSFVAGLGNIYTDESLYRASIHPLRRSDTISRSEAEALYDAIQQVLQHGIEKFGSSLDWAYRGGTFQNYFQVHQRKGESCPRCGYPIEKIRVGQRGTYICPHCQLP